jgi:hypothetical protein
MAARTPKRTARPKTALEKSRLGQKRTGQREAWTIVTGGRKKTVVMSAKSAAAMDDAVRRYARALKRLADR